MARGFKTEYSLSTTPSKVLISVLSDVSLEDALTCCARADGVFSSQVNVGKTESTGLKKMAAVHFTTIHCEPNRTISTHGNPYFEEMHLCTNKIVYARFDVFRPFLCVFIRGFMIFVR